MKHHEYANLFPMLPDSELRALAADIAANGLQTPITTLDDMILDGRNRHRACEIAGVDPTFEEYLGGDPLAFVISHNLHRRHLTESQRGLVAAKMADLPAHRPTGSPAIAGLKSQPEAAALLNVSVGSVQRAAAALRGEPELAAMVQAGELSVYAASDVARLPVEMQKEAIAGGADAVVQAAKKSRTAKKRSLDSTKSANTQSGNSENPQQEQSSTSRSKTPKYIPNDAEELWVQAKTRLDNILPSDPSRESVLNEVIDYCNLRIANKK
jgi:hypothetical protein